MALDSPFQSGGAVKDFSHTDSGKNLVIRVESGGSFQLNLKKEGVPSATGADYFLMSGDLIRIPGPCNVSCISITGNPKIYWTLEDKER